MHVVTGATGRLGSHLVNALVSGGKEVKVLVRSDASAPKGAITHIGDITKPETLEGLIGRGDTVFHLAALLDEGNSDEQFYKVNVLGTENLLSACRGKGIARFVLVSSIAVFGNLENVPANEADRKDPVTKYGRSKMLAEETVARKKKEIPFTIIRPGMIYGQGFDEGYIPVLKALERKKMVVIGNGENHMPLIHVSDVIEALLLASENEEAVGRDFVVAGPDQLTQKELLALAAKELGVSAPNHSIPLWLAKSVLPIAASFTGMKISPENLAQLARDRAFDCSKIKEKLGFVPKKEIAKGIKEMVEYYRKR